MLVSMDKFPFDADVHLKAPLAVGNNKDKVSELRSLMIDDGDFDELWCTDHTLTLFLIARNFNVQASHEMMVFAKRWRNMRQAHLVELQEKWVQKMSRESETGKIWCPGPDRWGRPIVIFDNTVQNTDSVSDQMLFLAWCLEFAIKDMPQHTDKYVVFMHLTKFSFFNTPPFAATKETAQMLCNCFPERAGHIVLYQPPFIFEAFYNSVQSLIDVKTRAKVVFIRGDDSVGSVNDQRLVEIIGPNWRDITGAGKPPIPHQEGKYGISSPGYEHEKHWKDVHRRIAERPQQKQVYHYNGNVIDNHAFSESVTVASATPSSKSNSSKSNKIKQPERSGSSSVITGNDVVSSTNYGLENTSVLQSLDDSRMIDHDNVYSYLENTGTEARSFKPRRISEKIAGRSASQVFYVSSTPPPASPNTRKYTYCSPML